MFCGTNQIKCQLNPKTKHFFFLSYMFGLDIVNKSPSSTTRWLVAFILFIYLFILYKGDIAYIIIWLKTHNPVL